MAKREDPWARLAKPQAPRVVGVHKGCGGTVLYTSTATRGWRHCQTCGANTNKGDACDVEER